MDKIALLIIDMQKDFVLQDAPWCIAGAHATIPIIKKILNVFREKKLPVFHIIRHYREDGSDVELPRRERFLAGTKIVVPGTEGAEVVDELAPEDREYVVVKQRYSAFFMTELVLLLTRLGIETVVITGTQDPNCVRATAYDAISYDYKVTLISDATSSATDEIHRQNLRDIAGIGVKLMTSDQLIKDLS
uniref:Nicotinamidase-related amidase n=1 Tax=Candidatus Kentrum sp. FW TaxID=2126338 RepID=A0A450SCH2_9GAMM|nr:MAG: Nicotinamidase-related amidase [Candidatus Kentron sp. FW]